MHWFDNVALHLRTFTMVLVLIWPTTGCSDGGRVGDGPDAGPAPALDGAVEAAGAADASGAMPLGPAGRPIDLGPQVGRIGRPGMLEVALLGLGRTPEARSALTSLYQSRRPENAMEFLPEVRSMLATLDSLDSACGNQWLSEQEAARYTRFAQLLLDDRIYLDSSKGDCSVFLGVELEALKTLKSGSGHCGGRAPLQDPVERLYSLAISGTLTGWDDGLAFDRRVPASRTNFPFIGSPNL